MFIYLAVGYIVIMKAMPSLMYKTSTGLGMVWPYTYETAIDCLFAIAEYMLEIYLVLFTLSCVYFLSNGLNRLLRFEPQRFA